MWHICVSKWWYNWFKWWLGTCSVSSQYPKQCCLIHNVNWKFNEISIKIQLNNSHFRIYMWVGWLWLHDDVIKLKLFPHYWPFVRGIHRSPAHEGTKTSEYIFIFDHVLTLIRHKHYGDVIMTTMASQIISLTVVYSIVYSGADQRKHQSSASLAFVWGIHRDRWIPRTKGQ